MPFLFFLFSHIYVPDMLKKKIEKVKRKERPIGIRDGHVRDSAT